MVDDNMEVLGMLKKVYMFGVGRIRKEMIILYWVGSQELQVKYVGNKKSFFYILKVVEVIEDFEQKNYLF